MIQKIKGPVAVILFLAVSAFFSYLLVPLKFFPYLSFSLVFSTLATIALIFKTTRTKYDYAWYFSALLFSFFLILRSNFFLTFINICAIFASISFLSIGSLHLNSILDFIFSPITIFMRSMLAKNKYSLSDLFKGKLDNKVFNFYSIGGSILFALVVIPLLASANPFFDKLIQDIFGNLLKENIVIHVVRVILFAIFVFLIPKFASYVGEENLSSKTEKSDEVNHALFLPKIVGIVILAVFFVTQVQLYTASSEMLTTLGYTHSKYAREVFTQLTVVSFLISTLVFFDKSHSKKSLVTTSILLIEGIVLCLVAFKSVNDYATTWGFTEKRLWGYTGVVWMLGVYGFFVFTHLKRLSHERILKEITVWSFVVLALVNLANFDFLIYHYAKASTQSGIDYPYLARLSPDANSYKDFLDKTTQVDSDGKIKVVDPKNTQAVREILWKIRDIQVKHKSNNDWRSFNIGQYLEFKDTESINVALYTKQLDELTGSSTPEPFDISKNIDVVIVGMPTENLGNYFWELFRQAPYGRVVGGNFAHNGFIHTNDYGYGRFMVNIYRRDGSTEVLVARSEYEAKPEDRRIEIKLARFLEE